MAPCAAWELQLSDVAPGPATRHDCSEHNCQRSMQTLWGCVPDEFMSKVHDPDSNVAFKGCHDTFIQLSDSGLTRQWAQLQQSPGCKCCSARLVFHPEIFLFAVANFKTGCLVINTTLGCLFLNATPRAMLRATNKLLFDNENKQMIVRTQPAGKRH
jgi:hypothetical protein